jgi:hypothetical protein
MARVGRGLLMPVKWVVVIVAAVVWIVVVPIVDLITSGIAGVRGLFRRRTAPAPADGPELPSRVKRDAA